MQISILIADDERAARHAMGKVLASPDYRIVVAEDGVAALAAIREHAPDLVLLDLNMPNLDGQSVLRELGGEARDTEIIVVSANDSVAAAVECIRLGAADYITKPYEVEQIRAIARRVARRVAMQRELGDLRRQLDRQQACGALVGVSGPMRELFDRIERAARAPVNVLIRGETGTGKELIAREIHRQSDRADGPFIAVNTAAIAETLAESELFGHVRGAFTGADADRQGVFKVASGGTLFLDEIGDMPSPAQAKILRALESGEVQPVGSTASVAVDVRVISATHQDLTHSIDQGHFRQDLYYRIRGVELNVPPLRHRREDIILLADYFLQRADATATRLAVDAVDALLSHTWPGNVRELEQLMTSAATMAASDVLGQADLGLTLAMSADLQLDFASLLDLPLTEAKARLAETLEREAITRALTRHNNNISAAARQLGIHRQSLQQKMTRLGIGREG